MGVLLAVHLAALAVWAGSIAVSHQRLRGEALLDPPARLALRRRVQPVFLAEHAAFALALATGVLLLALRGGGIGRLRWLTLKLGLVGLLIVPLEALHAFACHAWIARGIRAADASALPKDFVRGAGMEEMVRTLAAPLLGLAVPLIVWLSVAEPF